MEENSPDKTSGAPSVRASGTSATSSTPTRRSGRLKGDPPEFGLYEKPARSIKSLTQLHQLEVEEIDSASSAVSSVGSNTSKREAEDDSDVSPQSQVPTKLTVVESLPQENHPSVVEIEDTDSDEEKSRRPNLEQIGTQPDLGVMNQDDDITPLDRSPQPRVEYEEDNLPVIPMEQARILARFSENRPELMNRLSDLAMQNAAALHQQGYEKFLLQQQLAQAAEFRRYVEELESERNSLRLENQESRAVATRVLEMYRTNEESRVTAFATAMIHLQRYFEARLQAWTDTIRESYERQWSERELSLQMTYQTTTESPEFRTAVQNAVMAERQVLHGQQTTLRNERDNVTRRLEARQSNFNNVNQHLQETSQMLIQVKPESDQVKQEFRSLSQTLTRTQTEKDDLIGIKGMLEEEVAQLHKALKDDVSSAQAQRMEYESKLAHIQEDYEIQIQTLATKSDPDLPRLFEENERLRADREELLRLKTDWEIAHRNLGEGLETSEKNLVALRFEMETMRSQHEQELWQIRAEHSREQKMKLMSDSAYNSREKILNDEVVRLSSELKDSRDKEEKSAMRVMELELSVRSRHELIRTLETNLQLRASPRNLVLADCTVCPGLRKDLRECEIRIQAMKQNYEQDLSARITELELGWKEQCNRLESIAFSALQDVESLHGQLSQAEQESGQLERALQDLQAQTRDNNALHFQLVDRYDSLVGVQGD
ncbi:unnamed protein product [Aphanomyces euteiches]